MRAQSRRLGATPAAALPMTLASPGTAAFAQPSRTDSAPRPTVTEPADAGALTLQLADKATRTVRLSPGTWRDVSQGTVIRGPKDLKGYGTPLGVTPTFVNLKAKGADKAASGVNVNYPGERIQAFFGGFSVTAP
ncbi:hypothetical protein [Streptomyces sp. NPDC001020]